MYLGIITKNWNHQFENRSDFDETSPNFVLVHVYGKNRSPEVWKLQIRENQTFQHFLEMIKEGLRSGGVDSTKIIRKMSGI